MAKKQCWNCGTELDDYETFCPKCEVKQERSKQNRMVEKQCWKCGTELDDDETYCPKCEAKQGRSFISYFAQYVGYGTFLLLILIVGSQCLIGQPTSGSSENTNPTVDNNVYSPKTVQNEPIIQKVPVAPQLTAKEKNIQICEQVAEDYYSSHKYSMNVYDCDNMAQDVWNMLYAKGINAQIVVGNVDIDAPYTVGDCNHAWVIAEVSEEEWLAIECTGGYTVSDNERYYSGFFFNDPKEYQEFIRLRENWYYRVQDYMNYKDYYNKLVETYNNANYQQQQALESGLLVAKMTLEDKEQAYLKADMELNAILETD